MASIVETLESLRRSLNSSGYESECGDAIRLAFILEAAVEDILATIRASEQAASDQVPTEMADWPAPGELMEIHGK